MSDKDIEHMVELFGDKWILRDLDFFPEKLSDMAKVYPYKYSTWISITKGDYGIGFDKEIDAVDACIKIYNNLHRNVPDQLYKRYWELNHKK